MCADETIPVSVFGNTRVEIQHGSLQCASFSYSATETAYKVLLLLRVGACANAAVVFFVAISTRRGQGRILNIPIFRIYIYIYIYRVLLTWRYVG